ncbi:MAG: aldehyde dehydrogenase family protein [Galactobacter sp.]
MARQDMLIGNEWVAASSGETVDVRSPYDSRVVGTVPAAGAQDVEAAIKAAQQGAEEWRRTPAWKRADVLTKAAALADERTEDIARVMSDENGKTLTEARSEAGRTGDIIRLAAFEGTQLYGETLPLDANRGTGQEKIGFTLRQPVGIVAAITPFNYPALLVNHKIAPAIAAGNAVILKPATATPLTALAIAECFVDAGLPAGVLNVITGRGSTLGDALATDGRIRKISFTGSTSVGEHLAAVAGIKKLSLELGSCCPVIVLPDADLDLATKALALGAYTNTGEACISVQRVMVHQDIAAELTQRLKERTEQITAGDPQDSGTTIGPLISEPEAKRVEEMVQRAIAAGATLVTGGQREGAVMQPTLLTDVAPDAEIAQEEIFGPVMALVRVKDVDEAIEVANSSRYGLGAGVFTNDLDTVVRCAREIDAGTVDMNWTSLFRADLMPYGGLGASGIGKEGVRSAVEEMTEVKTVVLHGRPWS